MSETEEKRHSDYSIHPHGRAPGYSTAKPWKRQGKGKLGHKQRQLNARRNHHSQTNRFQGRGERAPGSMKGRS